MNDEQPPQAARPTPNRDGLPRLPPIIEGEVERLGAAPDPAPAPAAETTQGPGAAAKSTPDEEPVRRPPLLAPLLVVGAAALVSAGALYVLWPSGAGVAPAAVQALESRVSALEQETKAIESRAGQALARARETILAEAAQQAKAAAPAPLKPSPASPTPATSAPAPNEALAALSARLDALEKALAAPKSEGRAEPDVRAPAAPETAREPAPAPAVDLAPLERRLAALEGRLKPLEERLAPMQSALDQMRESLRAASVAETTRAQSGADQSRAAAQAAVAQALFAALDAGRPFAAELDALANLGAAAPRIDALKPFAQTGAPRLDALTRAFAQAEPGASRALAQALAPAGDGEASWFDRLARGASGLVRVRPAGDPDATSPADAMARIERALARGDLRGALAEWERMPEPARAASADWAKAARARLGADEAARSLFAEALSRLARP
jgi:hypothetical protein